jgi:hypothetical protein
MPPRRGIGDGGGTIERNAKLIMDLEEQSPEFKLISPDVP